MAEISSIFCRDDYCLKIDVAVGIITCDANYDWKVFMRRFEALESFGACFDGGLVFAGIVATLERPVEVILSLSSD